ncbi:hypothetical protein GGR51DRAFT_524710 [Nemania sp. FL0031]|nr:hypothetical protein GGR51DRAFT_524710 [Nemania sp. FL0031]
MARNRDTALTDETLWDETLSNIREPAIQCLALFYQLCAEIAPTTDDGKDAGKLMATFISWMVNTGVFRAGRRSLAARLKATPRFNHVHKQLYQPLFEVLKRRLEEVLLRINGADDSSSSSESDDSSDRSSYINDFRPNIDIEAFKDEQAPTPTQSAAWNSLRWTTASIRQLEFILRENQQEQFQRFVHQDQNLRTYQLFETYAREKCDFLFPNASDSLRERMANSIASRQARLLFLKQHQKTPTLAKQDSKIQAVKQIKEEEIFILSVTKQEQEDVNSSCPLVPLSKVPSNTVGIKLDPMRFNSGQNKITPSGSISLIKFSETTFPSIPNLDPGDASFTYSYYLLVSLVDEASRRNKRMSRLTHKLEPFFCVFDNCPSPFRWTDTYTGWLAHMRDKHSIPEWYCGVCKTVFSSSAKFQWHLREHHQDQIPELFRGKVADDCMRLQDKYPLQECPFCGKFPLEIEKDDPNQDDLQVFKSLAEHVRDHLISLSQIIPLVESEEMGESSSELDDTGSDDQTDSDSEHDIDRTSKPCVVACEEISYDYEECKKNSILDGSICPSHEGWEMEDIEAVSNITELWQEVMDKKTTGDKIDLILQSPMRNIELNLIPPRSSSRIAEPQAPTSPC